MNPLVVNLLAFYGSFLILCGIVSVSFIGMKAKTALISGGTSGTIALLISYLGSQNVALAPFAGLFLCTALLIIFSWRSTKTLLKVVELIPTNHPDLKGKVIAFLIISLMAVVTIFTLALQIIFLF